MKRRHAAPFIVSSVALATLLAARGNAEEAPASGESSTSRPSADANTATSSEARHTLTGDSTLAQWRVATPSERSEVAVAIARNRLPPGATKLDLAKMAMEISGCLTATAKDGRVDAWIVAPTATTCLTAPERDPADIGGIVAPSGPAPRGGTHAEPWNSKP